MLLYFQGPKELSGRRRKCAWNRLEDANATEQGRKVRTRKRRKPFFLFQKEKNIPSFFVFEIVIKSRDGRVELERMMDEEGIVAGSRRESIEHLL